MNDYEVFYQQHVQKFKSNGKQAYGLCPFHEDNLASFSINLPTGQFRCHGCTIVGNAITFARRIGVSAPIVDGASIAHPSHARTTTQPPTSPRGQAALVQVRAADESRPPSNLVATYVYEYEDGAPATRVLRYDPKSFRQQRWDGKNWIWSLEGARRVPYRLPKILAAKGLIYLVEGEKDVETLEKHGLTATTTPMGAKSWATEYASYFRGKFVVALPDNDEPGEAYARTAARDIRDAGGHVKIVRLARLPAKGDVSDFLAGIGTVEELQAAAQAAPPFAEKRESPLEPADYFKSLGLDPCPEGSYVPSEYRDACRRMYKAFTTVAGRCTDEVNALVAQAEAIWTSCTSKSEYEKFLRLLKQAHELSLVES